MTMGKEIYAANGGLPDLPSFISLLHSQFPDAPWISFFYHTQSIFFALLISLSLILLFHLGARHRALLPSKLQNFLEWIVESFREFVCGVLGEEGERFVPFLGTLFIYILSMNLVGLVPLMKAPSSNLNVTIALAICVFCLVQYLNIKHLGIRGFLFHLAGSPKDLMGWLIAPLMFPIELLTQISRPITLALRLFGNIFGEKILLAFFALVSATTFFFLPIQTPFMFLGLLTSVMQAMVFTLLSTIYIFLSLPSEEEH